MPAFDWSRFELRINVNANVEIIYNALTTSAGLESWFVRNAKYITADNRVRERDECIQKGDRYTWLWHGYGDDTVEHNDILEVNGSDLVSFVFAGHCIVTITIGILDSETIVQLTQENIPTGEEGKANIHLGCTEGWVFISLILNQFWKEGSI